MATPVTADGWPYWLLVAGSVTSAVLLTSLVGLKIRRGFAATAPPPHTAYHTDEFCGMVWRWRWYADGTFNPFSLTMYCPRCDRLLSVESNVMETEIACPPCGMKILGTPRRFAGQVFTELELLVRNGGWEQRMNEWERRRANVQNSK